MLFYEDVGITSIGKAPVSFGPCRRRVAYQGNSNVSATGILQYPAVGAVHHIEVLKLRRWPIGHLFWPFRLSLL